MESLRREPFRVLFPVGVLLGLAGVLPWLLFGGGFLRAWLGLFHALTMTEGFLVALAAGFLGTMVPRRTGSAPLSSLELGIMLLALAALPASLVFGHVALAQLAYAAVLGTLAQFAIRRFAARAQPKPVPPSFVFVPVALLSGMVGAALLAANALDLAGVWSIALGRSLVEEGVLLGLVLGLAPMLTPIICRNDPPPETPAQQRRMLIALHLAAALALALSFVLRLYAERAGLLLGGFVCEAELVLAGQLFVPATAPGLHRRLYRVALFLVPLGLVAAGVEPARRVPLLHLTFIGGFSLLIYAVSVHVTLLHTGREALASRRPWLLWIVAGVTLAAAAVRINAERFGDHFVDALTLASSLWLVGALAWLVFVVPKLTRRPPSAQT